MSRNSRAWILGAVAVVFGAGAAVGALPLGESPQIEAVTKVQSANDAGSGTDAGSTPLDALAIEGGARFYHGNLTPASTDRDWYRLAGAPQGPAFCAEGRVSSSVPANAVLAFRSDRSAEVVRSVGAESDAHLAVATLGGDGLWLGVESSVRRLSTTDSTTGPEHYRFELRMPDVPDVDPDTDSAGATVLDSPCFRGSLPAGDASDDYVLQTTSATRVTFSLAQDGDVAPLMDIVSPSGALVATIASGDIATVNLDEPGWWSLRVRPDAAAATAAAIPLWPLAASAQASTDEGYIVGITSDDDWCRPACTS